ncbi:2247_t:CDS:2, partial [Acaulospora colombiana]
MDSYSEQRSQDAEPIVVYHNNDYVLLEDNELQQSVNRRSLFSSFKIFKLKGPIDVNLLLDILFPSRDKGYFEVDVSDYNGESAKVRFNFSSKTHVDLIGYLQRAAQNLFQFSGNGLRDWIPADKVTNQLVYGNTYKQLSTFTTDHSNNGEEYPEIDENGLIAELESLAEQINSQRKGLSDEALNKIFFYVFRRSDMSVNLYDIRDEFFSQLSIVQFVRGQSVGKEDISSPDQIKGLICKLVLWKLQGLIDKSLPKIIKDQKFCLAIVLWNFINTLYAVHKSYQVLKDSNAKFREILREKKTIFISCLNNMEQWLVGMLKILANDLDQSQYSKFQMRLEGFLTAAENLLDTIKIIAVEYDSEIKTLEDQEKGLSVKWWLSAFIFGITATLGAGYIAYKHHNNQTVTKTEKFIAAGMGTVGAAALTSGHFVLGDLKSAILRQTRMLGELKGMHDKLNYWQKCGKDLQTWDQGKMNQHRNILIPQLNQIKLQSKEFEILFDCED